MTSSHRSSPRRKKPSGPGQAPTDQPGRDEPERLARAAWSYLADPADVLAGELVEAYGAVAALAAVRAGHGAQQWQDRLPSLHEADDLQVLDRLGGRLIIPGDPQWPTGFAALGSAAPFCLWARGPLHLGEATMRAAAIVGARAATPYGETVATDLGRGCTTQGITVVSGAAYGIDGAAHRGALAGGGPTVAVLAGGVDRPYPLGHQRLIEQIISTGVVISESPPGQSPSRSRFIARSRRIAALAQVSVVVEAAHRSGALGTASAAAALGRPVAAVPGPVTSAASQGCHQLLKNGAVCVTSADDIAPFCRPTPLSAAFS